MCDIMPGRECGVCMKLCPGGSVGWVCDIMPGRECGVVCVT